MSQTPTSEASHSDWHMLAGGASYGPYSWEQLVAYAREGRLAAGDLVWHPSLPGWTPAREVAGLAFPTEPAAAHPRRTKGRTSRLLLFLVPVAVVVIVLAVLAAAGVFSKDGPPLVETVKQGPTVIDVAVDSRTLTVTPEEGGRFEDSGFALEVPRGAVAQPTSLTVAEFLEPFAVEEGSPPADGLPHALSVGPMVDLGPEGLKFDEPVTVTLSYDETLLPPDSSESQVAIAYWDGRDWICAGGAVDKKENTVSIRLRQFDGLIVTTTWLVVGVGTIIAGEAYYLYKKWSNPEAVTSDPMSRKQADLWVTPTDPTVVDWASRAVFVEEGGTSGQIPLGDPSISDWAKAGKKFMVAYKKPDGTLLSLRGRFYAGPGSNWQMPADYFTKGDVKGDCTDVTNSIVSVLRSQGYRAKGVFGYAVDKDTSHVWGEVLIGGEPFLIDEWGILWPLNDGFQSLKLIRADPDDIRNAMWDENGQEPYKMDWWLQPESTTTTKTAPTSTTGIPPTVTTVIEGTNTVPNEPGYTVENAVQLSKAGDPSDLRILVTSTRSYQDDAGRDRTSVGVFEYLVIDGKVSDTASRRLYSSDGPSDQAGEALSEAAERIRSIIAEDGLVEGWPVS